MRTRGKQMTQAKAAYSRILVKLSGEALMGGGDYGIDPAVLKRITSPSKEVRAECCKILRDVGTEKCIPAIIQATKDLDPNVAREARLTLAEVRP